MTSLGSGTRFDLGFNDGDGFWWTKQPKWVKTSIVAVAIVVLAACLIFSQTGSPRDIAVLTGAPAQELSQVAQRLDTDHIRYDIVDSGHTIKVSASDRDRAQDDLSQVSASLSPSASSTTDWLGKVGLTTDGDVESAYVNHANESELADTISSLSEVSSASVHLTTGKQSAFTQDSTPTSASVVVTVKPGQALSPSQVAGIASLVAHSVTGLSSQNVLVLDSSGNPLWGLDASNPNPVPPLVAEDQQYGEQLRAQIQSHLDSAVGTGRSLVTVDAELAAQPPHAPVVPQPSIRRLAIAVLIDSRTGAETITAVRHYLTSLIGSSVPGSERVVDVEPYVFSNIVSASQDDDVQLQRVTPYQQRFVMTMSAIALCVAIVSAFVMFTLWLVARKTEEIPNPVLFPEKDTSATLGGSRAIPNGTLRIDDMVGTAPNGNGRHQLQDLSATSPPSKLEELRRIADTEPEALSEILKEWIKSGEL
jgi:flagellar biosynthesis/type III secretory pathway M-ring protein FliF/YscJ